MIENNYITIPGWMAENLKLKGSELLAYALIYGFTQDKVSDFHGSITYIAKWLNLSRRRTIETLKRLEDKSLIIKTKTVKNNIETNHYTVNQKHVRGSDVSSLGGDVSSWGSDVSSPNIYKDNPIRVLGLSSNSNYRRYHELSDRQSFYYGIFEDAYPKRTSYEFKRNCLKWFAKNIADDDFIVFSNLMRRLEADKKSEAWMKQNGRFVPRPDIWLKDINIKSYDMQHTPEEIETIANIRGKWLPE